MNPSFLYRNSIRALYEARDIYKGIKKITSDEALEECLALTGEAFQRSHHEGMNFVRTWRYQSPNTLPLDPFSPAYRDAQLEIYQKLSKRNRHDYREVEQGEPEADILTRLYPYSTQNLQVIGPHLQILGYWASKIVERPHARIIEFGAGLGDFSLILARAGFQVTTVDISARYSEVVRRRAVHEGVTIEAATGDMSDYDDGKIYDAAVFCEAFHHSDDHVRLLQNLDKILDRQTGKIYFFGEPVTVFDRPWGVRLDGESVWAARAHGWLELGFDFRYFEALLKRMGWKLERQRNKAVGHGAYLLLATRA